MPIFMLSPKGTETQATGDLAPEDKPNTNPEKKEIVPEIGYMPTKEIDEKTLVIDGPLSQVYTDALNQAYAKECATESYITELATLADLENKELEKEEQDDAPSYVYVMNGAFLEGDGYLEAFESFRVALDKCKKVYICVEHDMNITPRVAGFLGFARTVGATVLRDRETAMKTFVTKMKKK